MYDSIAWSLLVLCVSPGLLSWGGGGVNTTTLVQGFWSSGQEAGHELQQTEVSWGVGILW